MENNKQKENDKESENKNNSNQPKAGSVLTLVGAKPPLSLYTRRVIDTSDIRKFFSENSSHGLCGSHNLGNTCFMNSSIACLSNCIELTYYFLNGDYKKDINRENKLGMRGALAESWGELIRDYWIGSSHVGDPSDFKRTFGNKIKRFVNFYETHTNEEERKLRNKQELENYENDLKKDLEDKKKIVDQEQENLKKIEEDMVKIITIIIIIEIIIILIEGLDIIQTMIENLLEIMNFLITKKKMR